MGTVYRPRRRARLRESEIENLKADLVQRQQLRAVMNENSHQVLSMEFNVHERTIRRLEQRGPVVTPYTKLALETMQAIYRRREIYWSARKLHDAQFSRKKILERYNVSQETLLRWMHAAQDEQRQAIWRGVNEDLREVA